jgi:hypothetical protein
MGAALTYARRYALFTLVGIAGEDDLDAPDLAGHPADDVRGGNRFDQAKVTGGGGTLGAFAKNRKPWTPPKETLAPGASATLRDRLLGELSGLTSADEATAWAQRALGAKNTLRDVDAALVEAAFVSRMAELEEDSRATLHSPHPETRLAEAGEPPGRAELMLALRASVELGAGKEKRLPGDRRGRKARSRDYAPPQPDAPSQPEVPPVNNAVVWHVGRERPVFTVVIRQ